MGLSKQELIGKLNSINQLYQKTLAIEEKMEEFEPEDHYKRKCPLPIFPGKYDSADEREEWMDSVDHEEDDAIEEMEGVYASAYEPKKPEKPLEIGRPQTVTDEEEKLKKKMGCFSVVAVGLGALAFITALTTGGSDPTTAAINWVLVLACAAFLGYYYYQMSLSKKKDEQKLRELQERFDNRLAEETAAYEQKMKQYDADMAAYREKCDAFMEQYKAWREVYFKHLAEEEEIDDKLEADRVAGVEKIHAEEYEPALQALADGNDLIGEQYLPALNIIVDLLESNRADDLKEAINLFEELLYRERQLQLQREQEEQRRREEEQRREDEERRHQEEMAFQREQERERRYEAERQERMAERQLEEQKRQEFDRQRAERIARETQERKEWQAELDRKKAERSAINRQCNTCARCGKCSLSFTRANCASYIPR